MKNKRIKFLPGEQKIFMEKVCLKSLLSTLQLSRMVKVHPRSFSDWRREKTTMSLFAAEKFCEKFDLSLPEKKHIMVARWIETQKDANRRGGRARYELFGSPGTPEGRRKGGIKAIANLKRNGIVPRVKRYKIIAGYSEELAEFVGIMLGDGGITRAQCTITLNSEKDKAYSDFVSELGVKLFGEKPKRFKRKNENTAILYYYGSMLIQYLILLGLKSGNKVKQQVEVPSWVNESLTYKKACLRGLMDTDGGIFLHTYTVKGKEYSYKKLSFTNKSVPLLSFVKLTLEELGFTPKIIDKVENKKVWLYNMQEVDRYLDIVGTHNPRLLALYGG